MTLGLSSSEFLEFKRSGGNIELLEHSLDVLFSRLKNSEGILNSQEAKDENVMKSMVVKELEKYIQHETQHRNANIFIKYLNAGGNLNVLKEFARDRSQQKCKFNKIKIRFKYNIILDPLKQSDIDLMTKVIDMFPNRSKMIREIDKFMLYYFKVYTAADLLQKYLKVYIKHL